jgi:hypothetical protein
MSSGARFVLIRPTKSGVLDEPTFLVGAIIAKTPAFQWPVHLCSKEINTEVLPRLAAVDVCLFAAFKPIKNAFYTIAVVQQTGYNVSIHGFPPTYLLPMHPTALSLWHFGR